MPQLELHAVSQPTSSSAAALAEPSAPPRSVFQGAVPEPAAIECSPAPRKLSPRWHTAVKWFANVSLLGGGAAMAYAPQVSLSPWAFSPFLVAHVIWAIYTWYLGERELFYLNLGATGLDLWAILARLP